MPYILNAKTPALCEHLLGYLGRICHARNHYMRKATTAAAKRPTGMLPVFQLAAPDSGVAEAL